MKPFLHARGSASRWGGKPEDYIEIHDFIDSSKAAMPDMRHRAALHNAFGCFLVERVFGRTIVNSDGREVSTRDVAESHIIEDMGFLPSLEDWLDELPLSKWHGGIHRLPRDQRPPTPVEARDATRKRVREILSIRFSPSVEIIDALIAAVR
ncbi:MAG: DUF6915 family protein, partial [Kofleriaceae bacterium]